MRPGRGSVLQWFVTGTALVYFALLHLYGVNIGEESATVFLLYRTARGEWPYLDFTSGYTPGYFLFHALLFRVFGEHLSVVRLCLVAVHTGNTSLVYYLGLRFLSPGWAVVAAMAYPALLPVVETSELSFNVPYPAWYCITFTLLGWLAVARAMDTKSRSLWFLAGLLAGCSFAFKPNSGLFQLAFTTLAAVGAVAGIAPAWAAGLAGCIVAGVVAVFRYHVFGTPAFVFLGPFVVTATAWLWQNTGRAGDRLQETARPSLRWLQPVAYVAGGFAAITIPWLLPYGFYLGAGRVWREVLFVGAGYEQHFYIAYEWSWSLFFAALLAAEGVWWWPAVIRGATLQRLTRWLLAAVATAALAYAIVAPKPEGVAEAVISAVRRVSFIGLPFVHWVVGCVALGARALGRQNHWTKELVLLSLGAQSLFWNAYPRSDFFHLAYAAPLSVILCCHLAERCARRWAPCLGRPPADWWVRATATTALGLLLVCAAPQLRVCAQVVCFFLTRCTTLEWWDTPKATVLIRGDDAGRRQREFAAVGRWLAERQAQDTYLLTFPDLDLLGFLVGTRHPARIGYFKSGWPGHRAEAEVIDDLERRPPKFIVTEYPPSLFFVDAAGFFFLLRHWVEQRYAVVEHLGRFRVWAARKDDAAHQGPEKQAYDDVWSEPQQALSEPKCDRGRLHAARANADPRVVHPWVEAWLRVGLQLWDVGCVRLGLRVAAELGDAAAGWRLASARLSTASPVYGDWANALWNIALRNLFLRWQFGGTVELRNVKNFSDLQLDQVVGWLEKETDVRVRVYLASVLASHGSPQVLRRALLTVGSHGGSPPDVLQRAILSSRLEDGETEWTELAESFEDLPAIVPALFLDWAQRNKAASERVMERAFRSARPAVRETVAYASVPLEACSACPTLQWLEKRDAAWQVRWAAQWARKRLGCDSRCTSYGLSG